MSPPDRIKAAVAAVVCLAILGNILRQATQEGWRPPALVIVPFALLAVAGTVHFALRVGWVFPIVAIGLAAGFVTAGSGMLRSSGRRRVR
jgi:protein-S-isoprenylcysteine O-methyltransferase Ste14